MLAQWLSAFPGPPVNGVPADAVDWRHIRQSRSDEVDVVLEWDAGRGVYTGTATAWTREHVKVDVSVPGRGVMRLWVQADDVRRRDGARTVEPAARRWLPARARPAPPAPRP